MRRFVVAAFFPFVMVFFMMPDCAHAAPPGTCVIQYVANSLNFPDYDAFSAAPTDVVGGLKVQCADAGDITITLGASPNSGGFVPRQMKEVDFLNYNLFRDAARTEIWGDGGGGTFTVIYAHPGSNNWATFDIYGRIPPQQNISASAPGQSYTDSIVATVVWAGGSDSANAGVKSTVINNCLFSSGPGVLDFGYYGTTDPGGGSGSASLSFSCSLGSSYIIRDDAGLYEVTLNVPPHRMISAGNYLSYTITYDDGDGAYVDDGETGVGGGIAAPVTLTINGVIPPLQSVPEGSYTDTIIFTVQF